MRGGPGGCPGASPCRAFQGAGSGCQAPGEIGQHPTEPLTARLLGVDNAGSPDPGASPSKDLVTGPGYDDTWFDLDTRTFKRA